MVPPELLRREVALRETVVGLAREDDGGFAALGGRGRGAGDGRAGPGNGDAGAEEYGPDEVGEEKGGAGDVRIGVGGIPAQAVDEDTG